MNNNPECIKYQDLFLQGRIKDSDEHMNSCRECRDFVRSVSLISSLKPRTVHCPPHLTFEKIMDRSAQKGRVIHFKKASFAVAAALILVLQIPFMKQNFRSDKTDFAMLSNKISTEISGIDQEIAEMENHFYSADDVIDNELSSLSDEMDNYTV